MVAGSLPVSNSFVSPYSDSFVSRLLVVSGSLTVSNSFVCPHITIDLSPSLAGGVRLFGCLEFICLFIKRFICLPVWLVVSGFWAVCNSFVSRYGNLFVSQSGWWCPALGLSRIHLSLHITIHLSPKLAGGVRLSGCLEFICLPV